MSSDTFRNASDSPFAPSAAPFAVMPSDSTELQAIPKALYVGTGGDVAVRGVRGDADVLFRNVPAGSVLDVRARFVRATGTTAADIVALA
jgi:hypothetical protein